MSEQSPPSGNFVKAFIPGLIVGFVVGALVGVVIAATEGDPTRLGGGGGTTIGDPSERGPRDGIVEDTQQQLEEAGEAMQDAAEEGAAAAEEAAEEAGAAIEEAADDAVEAVTGDDSSGG